MSYNALYFPLCVCVQEGGRGGGGLHDKKKLNNFFPVHRIGLKITPFNSEWPILGGNMYFGSPNPNFNFYMYQGADNIWGPGKNLFFLFWPGSMGPQKKLHIRIQGVHFRGGRTYFQVQILKAKKIFVPKFLH